MRKLYGDQIRKEAGLTKTLKTAAIALPKQIPEKLQQEIAKLIHEKQDSTKNVERIVKETVEKVEKAVEDTKDAVGDIVDAARPRLQEVLSETKQLLEASRSRVIPLTASDIEMFDLSCYSISISSTKNVFEMGSSIQVTWKAPKYHGAQDWIGIYEMKANKSRHITNVSSRGLWHWTNAAKHPESGDTVFPPETAVRTEGILEFNGSKLPWKVGTYEFRYQHDNKHNVMAVSVPFEIKAPTIPAVIDIETTKQTLLRWIQNTLGNNADIIPRIAEEEYVGMGEVESTHLVKCIKLTYKVEFAWEVVATDKTAVRLANRVSYHSVFDLYKTCIHHLYQVLHAREALSPFTSESSRRLSSASLHLASNTCSAPLIAKVSGEVI
jgi:phosphatidylethanolamine N-methyltransferase